MAASGFVQRWRGKTDIGYGNIHQSGIPSAGAFLSTAAPTNGTNGTFAKLAPPGALLIDQTNKILYQNVNTQVSPTWSDITAGSSVSFAPITGSTVYAPLSGSTAYAPVSGSTVYAPISGSSVYAPASGSTVYSPILAAIDSVSTQGAPIGNGGVTEINSTDAGVLSFPIAAPAAGIRKQIEFLGVGPGVQITCSTGATFDGTNTVLGSTVLCAIGLRGLSVNRWAIESAYYPPASTSMISLGTST